MFKVEKPSRKVFDVRIPGAGKAPEAKYMKVSANSVAASLCKASFYDFLQEFWGEIIEETPVFNWHVEYLCMELQKEAERVFRREERKQDTVINIPPGSTKSTICSQMFLAWVWTWWPAAQFICVSYAFGVAKKDAIKCRDIVQSEKYQKYFPGITMREDANTLGLFVNTKKGFRLSVGVQGAVTGFHGHFLLVDDPLDPEKAYSEAELKMVNRWMRTTLPSRRLSKNVSPIILVQQRLHQNDPSGDMLDREQGGARHICLPGELTDDVRPVELRQKYVDGLLDPVRLSKGVLTTLEEELGAYGYASQILQTPVPLEGSLFEVDKLHLMDEAPALVEEVIGVDKAGTAGGGKYSVFARMGRDALKRYWITDVRRGQWSSAVREAKLLQFVESCNVPVVLEIEGGSGGKESGESTVANLAGYRVITFHPTGDKEARAFPLSSQMGGGNVYMLKRAWTKVCTDELRLFPYGRFSDQVDALSGAFNQLARKKLRVGAMFR